MQQNNSRGGVGRVSCVIFLRDINLERKGERCDSACNIGLELPRFYQGQLVRYLLAQSEKRRGFVLTERSWIEV